MIVTDTVELADGSSAANLFLIINLHTGSLETTGKAPVDLSYWRTEADRDAGKEKVYPVISGNKIASCELEFTGAEIVKVGANCTVADTFTFYKEAVIEKLDVLYGWTVTL